VMEPTSITLKRVQGGDTTHSKMINFRQFRNFIIGCRHTTMDNKQRFLNKKLSLEENNLCVQFVTTGERPQSFIKNTDAHTRFMEYPKVNALIQ
jgi:hypothetical protein